MSQNTNTPPLLVLALGKKQLHKSRWKGLHHRVGRPVLAPSGSLGGFRQNSLGFLLGGFTPSPQWPKKKKKKKKGGAKRRPQAPSGITPRKAARRPFWRPKASTAARSRASASTKIAGKSTTSLDFWTIEPGLGPQRAWNGNYGGVDEKHGMTIGGKHEKDGTMMVDQVTKGTRLFFL